MTVRSCYDGGKYKPSMADWCFMKLVCKKNDLLRVFIIIFRTIKCPFDKLLILF